MTPDQVLTSVLESIYRHERIRDSQTRYAKTEAQRDSIERVCAEAIEEEWSRYSTVQIIRFKDGYGLVYAGDEMHERTGAFATREEAAAWFINGGR